MGTSGLEPGDDGENVMDRVIGAGDPQRVGTFRFFLHGSRWEWSLPVAQMHGYTDGDVTPTTELLLSHKHPEDRDRVAAVLDRVSKGEPFSSRHRIVDTQGHTHWVVVVGDQMHDQDGTLIGTAGFYVDITSSVQSDKTAAIAESAESRAKIEQAKAVLMLMYGIDADRAFDVLTWRSQHTNIKVRDLADRLLAAVGQLEIPERTRTQFDHILLALD